jgi:hypothetical protein
MRGVALRPRGLLRSLRDARMSKIESPASSAHVANKLRMS